MRSRRAAEAFAVKRSGGIQGMSMWQSAEILVYFIVSPSILSAWRRRRGTPPGGKHDEQIGQPPHGSLPGIWSAHHTPPWPHPTGRPAYWANLLRHIDSALASHLRCSARTTTFSVASNAQRTYRYASHCWLPRAWRFELRGVAPRRGLG